MTPRVGNIVIDCADLDAMAAFWGGLLGMKTSAVNADWLDLEPLGTGGPVLSFQRVPEGKKAKNRLHLDLDVPDVRAAGERAARPARPPPPALWATRPLPSRCGATPRATSSASAPPHDRRTAARRRTPSASSASGPRSRTRSAGTGPGPRRGRRAVPR